LQKDTHQALLILTELIEGHLIGGLGMKKTHLLLPVMRCLILKMICDPIFWYRCVSWDFKCKCNPIS